MLRDLGCTLVLLAAVGCGGATASGGGVEAGGYAAGDCPNEGPEDIDGYQDHDNCPEPDNDNDGIPDERDGAPLEPEDIDGFEDEDGIPDPVHPDGGGGGESGGGNGGETSSGSASPKMAGVTADLDNDGLLDPYDLCLEGAEDRDGFEDRDGCPDPDNDQDGIPDTEDACPSSPGEDCVQTAALDIKNPVVFRAGKAKMDLRKSRAALAEILGVLQDERITKLEVQGHTDNRGKAKQNLKLSEKRAKAVVKYLVKKGIAKNRLEGRGYGDARPIQSNDTKEGRDKNRRVEFHILEKEE